jgi:clan AA aspartic protease
VVVRRGRGEVVGFIHVPVSVKASSSAVDVYTSLFLVDTGAMDSVIPASELRKIGIEPVATEAFELADGSVREFAFGLAQLEVMGKVTAGRVLFGPDGIEPLLGVAPLQSAGFTVDPANHTLRTIRLRV